MKSELAYDSIRMVDKRLGIWLLRDTLSNGRVFSHTLVFSMPLAAAGIYLCVSRRRVGLLCLLFVSMAHLCLDKMWFNPRTLLWLLYGWSFEKTDVGHWLEWLLTLLQTEPRQAAMRMILASPKPL